MILNVCLNPYIDVHMEINSLSVGMVNEVISKHTFYTGRAINVAVGLSRLGVHSFLTGFMFEDDCKLFEEQLHKEGVDYKFVWSEGRVSVKYKVVDRKSMMTEMDDIHYNTDENKHRQLVELTSRLAVNHCEAVVLCGEQYNAISPEFFAKILSGVPDGVKKIVDAEGEYLIEALKYGVDLVKPNLDELQRTLHKSITTKRQLIDGCNELIEMGAKVVLVSLGKKGAVITDGHSRFYCKSINVAMNSTAGAGDAMVAGATKALVQGYKLEDILRCGVAAGTAAVTLPDSNSFEKDKYDEIKTALIVKEI